eukprot:2430067-Heterocapsa_arctica.AAC.1
MTYDFGSVAISGPFPGTITPLRLPGFSVRPEGPPQGWDNAPFSIIQRAPYIGQCGSSRGTILAGLGEFIGRADTDQLIPWAQPQAATTVFIQ